MFNKCIKRNNVRISHQWEEVRRHCQPPATSFDFGGGFWSEEYTDIVKGWTMIELKCINCGNVKTTKISYTGE